MEAFIDGALIGMILAVTVMFVAIAYRLFKGI